VRFWRLFTSHGVGSLVDGVGRATLPLLATTLTDDAVLIAGLAAVTYLPWLFCAYPPAFWSIGSTGAVSWPRPVSGGRPRSRASWS
jgi:hypothetical protein